MREHDHITGVRPLVAEASLSAMQGIERHKERTTIIDILRMMRGMEKKLKELLDR